MARVPFRQLWVVAAALGIAASGCSRRTNVDGDAMPPPTGRPESRPMPEETPLVEAPDDGARTQDEKNTIEVFEAAAAATVFVTQSRIVRQAFTLRATEVPAGSGTGFIWDKAGHIVTNFHVVASGRHRAKLSVALFNRKTYPATIVGTDPNKDIAVIKVEAPAEDLVAIRQPPENYNLDVGQKAVAIGNPFGLDHTLTTGVVSALGREVLGIGGVTIRDMIQTDAAINPGNSGGPLLDSQGQLIGMNTMIYSQSGASAGIGFAVPVKAIQRVVPQIIKHGRPERVGLGVILYDVGRTAQLGINGVVIQEVRSQTAKKAGLRGFTRTPYGVELGDVIIGINEHEVTNYDDFYNAVDRYRAGDNVTVKYVRDGKIETVDVELIVVNSP